MVDAPETYGPAEASRLPLLRLQEQSAAAEQPLRLLRREIEDLKRVLSARKSRAPLPAGGQPFVVRYRVRDRRRAHGGHRHGLPW